MINIEITNYIEIIAFWLVFTRVMTIIFQLPIYDNVTIPSTVKILSAILIAYTFFPYVEAVVIKDIHFMGGVDSFWILTIYNVIIGLLIGYLVKAIMSLFTSAGTVMTQQMGFAALRYFDPTAGTQIGPYEKLIQWTVLVMIISSGALLPMFKGVFGSFASIHAHDWGKMAHLTEFFVPFFKTIFYSALMLASPLIVTNVLVMVVLGIIARTVPQMNVLMVSFIVNIGMGLLIFISISEEFFHVAYKLYVDKLGEWFLFIT